MAMARAPIGNRPMRAYVIIAMSGGQPSLEELPYAAYTLGAHIGQDWGLYFISGTDAQITDILALGQVTLFCTVAGELKSELDEIQDVGVTDSLNAWLSGQNLDVLPPGCTNREALETVGKKLNSSFGVDRLDITDARIISKNRSRY